jgi:FixJ family two-component response regulator
MDARSAGKSPVNPPVVYVIDDDAAVRTSLARLLRCAGYDARTYETAAAFLVADRKDVPGCIVLDLGLPGMSGMELQAVIAKIEATLPIVFLTGRGDIETSVRAMKAGAVDFLTKPVKRDALLAAVGAALALDAELRSRRDEARALHAKLQRLTAREREVLELVVRGRLNKQIADALGTSIRTVKAHRAHVMTKMEVGSLAELVNAAARFEFVTHP